MHSLQLTALAQSIWQKVIHQRVHLLIQYIRRMDKTLADLLNRMHQQVHEWKLHPQVLLLYFQ